MKGFVREKNQSEKFYRENLNFMERNMAMARIQGIFQPLVQVISALAYVIVLAFGGYLAIHSFITLGDFVAFNMYLGELVWPMMAIGWVVNLIQRGQASMKRINVLLSYPAEVQESANVAAVTQLSGQVSVQQLSFQYPDAPAPALSGISFQLFPGKQIGIIGRTGAGKSTLCNLLIRLMEASAGSIRYDGIDIRQIPLQTLREQIGYVPQDNFLFSTTLRENIAFHPYSISQEEVVWAAKVAQIYDEIMAMPKQFDTVIGVRGITLSGGQKQRVAIARALVKHPRLLLLDDCLSAVDTQTEEKILQGLKQVMPECATLFISHRISSIMDADEILVIEEGQILERGTHAQLLAKGGLYTQLYERQQLEHEVVNS
ncbi:MAG: ABC transporter ATP-binding protein [Firmicutes bacterium]|nr:ABC transporter ATP-binding protein [Bacillota bacterium]